MDNSLKKTYVNCNNKEELRIALDFYQYVLFDTLEYIKGGKRESQFPVTLVCTYGELSVDYTSTRFKLDYTDITKEVLPMQKNTITKEQAQDIIDRVSMAVKEKLAYEWAAQMVLIGGVIVKEETIDYLFTEVNVGEKDWRHKLTGIFGSRNYPPTFSPGQVWRDSSDKTIMYLIQEILAPDYYKYPALIPVPTEGVPLSREVVTLNNADVVFYAKQLEYMGMFHEVFKPNPDFKDE